MYDGDAPLAERRAGALTLDRDLLRELLGQEELRELLDPDALADLELSLQALTDDRRATTADQLHDLLRRLGDLSADEIAARERGRCGGRRRLAGRAGRVPPGGARPDRRRRPLDRDRGRRALSRRRRRRATDRRARPRSWARPSARWTGLLARFARTHGPFLTPEPARRWGLPAGSSRTPWSGCWRRARSCAASSGRAAPSASGAIRTCCGCSGADRWRGSGARSSRSIRRRSPGSCRRGTGVAPVGRRDAAAPRQTAALERLAEVVDQLAGVPIPASVLERDILPARDPGLPAAAARRAGGAGRGRLGGAREPRSRRRPDRPDPARPRARSARPAPATARTDRPARATSAIREHLPRAARRSTASCSPRPAAARTARCSTPCGISSGPARSRTTRSRRSGRCAGSGPARRHARRRPGRLTALGPPEAAGRWSLVVDADRAGRRRSGSTRPALALLDRHGVVTREAVAGEGVEGGFSAVYPVLRALEEAGRIRRGYFVDGLGAAQFALAGALDRLRAVREPGRTPRRAARSTCWPPPTRRTRTARRCRGRAAARPTGGRSSGRRAPTSSWSTASPPSTSSAAAASLQTLPAADDPAVGGRRPGRSAALVDDGRVRELVIRKVDGEPVARVAVPDASCSRPGSCPATAASCSAAIDPPPAGELTRDARRRHALPDGGRPRGRTSSAGPSRRPGPAPAGSAGPADRRARDHAVEAVGKNLLIRFDNGLEIRTHLRMNGSWHRYRPGERWRRPAARARLVSRSRARSRSASTPRSSSCSSSAPRRSTRRSRRLGPDLLAAGLRRRPRRSAGCVIRPARPPTIGEALLDQRALAGIGNIWQERDPVRSSGSRPFAAVARRSTTRPSSGWSRPPGGCWRASVGNARRPRDRWRSTTDRPAVPRAAGR